MGEVSTRRYAWLLVGLLWVVGALNYIDRVMLITMRLSVKEAIPMTDTQFGLLTTVFLLTYAVLSPIGGFVADRLGCSRTIIFSLIAWSVITWLTAYSTRFSELLASRALMGISEAFFLPAASALIAKYHGNATRSLANGILLSGLVVGAGLGGLGGWLAERHGWSFAFVLFGIAGVAYSGVLVLVVRDPPARAESTPASPGGAEMRRLGILDALRSLFSRGDFTIALILWAILFITTWAFIGWMPAYLTEHFQLAQGQAGLTATVWSSLGCLAGMVVSGAWADRWCRRRPEARAWVAMIGAGLCAPCMVLVATTGSLLWATAGIVLFGFTRAFPDANMMPLMFQKIDPRYRATGIGLLNAFGGIAGGITIYIGGALRDAQISITSVFLAGAAGLALCAGLFWVIRPRALEHVTPLAAAQAVTAADR